MNNKKKRKEKHSPIVFFSRLLAAAAVVVVVLSTYFSLIPSFPQSPSLLSLLVPVQFHQKTIFFHPHFILDILFLLVLWLWGPESIGSLPSRLNSVP